MLDAGMMRIMLQIFHRIGEFLANFRAPRETLSKQEVRRVLDAAWIDNGFFHVRFNYAKTFARGRFNEVVGAYVREYHARTGLIPMGWHQVSSGSLRQLYFSKGSAHREGPFNADRSSAS